MKVNNVHKISIIKNITASGKIYDAFCKGDLVATQGTNCSIVILANDEAYGVFRFMPPLAVTAEEGSHVDLTLVHINEVAMTINNIDDFI